jgi:HAD superfamily hydrolase (TIGR01549 family)
VQRLALFDLDDRLIDRRAAFAAWAAEFCDDRGLGPDGHAQLLAADARHSGPRQDFFTTVSERLAPAEPPDRLWEQYRRRMPHLATCRDEDLAALARLRDAGWRLGVVTNGMADNQLGKLRHTGLDAAVHGWAISGQVGVRKPDPGLFAHAARQCGCDLTGGGWMVGDSLDLDVGGGRAAGLRTIWLDRNARWSGAIPSPGPDHRADSVPEAVDLLMFRAG